MSNIFKSGRPSVASYCQVVERLKKTFTYHSQYYEWLPLEIKGQIIAKTSRELET